MKRYVSLFKEAKQVGILYHFTDLYAAESILEKGYIEVNAENAISLTRNYNFSGRGKIRFVIDGNKLSNNFKIEPYLYKNDKAFRHNFGEYEERVYQNIPLTYVLEVEGLDYKYIQDQAEYYPLVKDSIQWVEQFKPFKN